MIDVLFLTKRELDTKRYMSVMEIMLKVKTLTVTTESLSIGAEHRDLLHEKLGEFLDSMDVKKHQLEEEYRKLTSKSGREDDQSPDLTESLRGNLQQELDILHGVYQERLDQLFARFQREWAKDPRDKAATSSPPRSGTESMYLSKQLGDALGHALTEICERRPLDPIEYLASWLRKYAENVKLERENAISDLKIKLQLEENALVQDRTAAVERERLQIKLEEGRRRKIYLENATRVAKSVAPSDTLAPESDDSLADTAGGGEISESATSGGGKRVTLVEPETSNSLYTIEERENETVLSSGELNTDVGEEETTEEPEQQEQLDNNSVD